MIPVAGEEFRTIQNKGEAAGFHWGFTMPKFKLDAEPRPIQENKMKEQDIVSKSLLGRQRETPLE